MSGVPGSSSIPVADLSMGTGEEEYDEDDLGGTGNAEDEETFAEDHQDASNSDRSFDEIVGALEEMLMDDEFTSRQMEYLNQHAHEFEDNDENKLSYTGIFDRYVEQMEAFIDGFLSHRIPNFSMEKFLQECETRGEEQLCGDAFDVLTSMSDFAAFKELCLAHKQKDQWSVAQNTGPQSPAAKAHGSSSSVSSV